MPGRVVFIRNPRSGLVLDASQFTVTISSFINHPTQLWRLEPTVGGKFFIVNEANRHALEIDGYARSGANIVTNPKSDAPRQKWNINFDDTIVCQGTGLALDIYQGTLKPGTKIIAWPHHGAPNQQFVIIPL